MNNDPLKKYVDARREQFDHLEPDEAVFSRIKATLKTPVVQPGKNTRLQFRTLWIAASLLILIPAAYLLLRNNEITPAIQTPKITSTKTGKALKTETENIAPYQAPSAVAINRTAHPKAKREKQHLIDMSQIYTDMADSTSASIRLAAILKMERSNLMSYDLIHRLSETLNNDDNSNVRLAALNVMSKYISDTEVMNACVLSLDHQTDPTLQLALIELLRPVSHPKLDDTLYALANNPATLSVVKNQAYLTLLNQDKL